jgi:hypothetical protein
METVTTQEKEIETPVSNQYISIELRYDNQEEFYWRTPFFHIGLNSKNGEVMELGCSLGSMYMGDILNVMLRKRWNEEKGAFNISRFIFSRETNYSLDEEERDKGKYFSQSQKFLLTGVLKVFEEHFPGALKGKVSAGRERKVPNIPYKVRVLFSEEGAGYRELLLEEGQQPKTKEQDRKDALSLLEKSVFPYMTNQTLVDRIKNLLQQSA